MSRKLRISTLVAALMGMSVLAFSAPAQAQPSPTFERALSWLGTWLGVQLLLPGFNASLSRPTLLSAVAICGDKSSEKTPCGSPGQDAAVTDGGCGVDPYGQPRCEQ